MGCMLNFYVYAHQL